MRQKTLAWLFLILAINFEVVFGSTLPLTEGFSQLEPSILNVITGGISVIFLSQSVKLLPISVAYPLWVGLGGTGVSLCGFVIYHENLDLWQILSIGLIILGAIGLELGNSSKEDYTQEVVEGKGK